MKYYKAQDNSEFIECEAELEGYIEISKEEYDRETAMPALQSTKPNPFKRIKELTDWFEWYDVQSIQYARDIRVFGSSSINIASLDNQAILNAEELKSLRNSLQN